MFTIATLNKISKKGLARFPEGYQIIEDASAANGILVRSQDMKAMDFSSSLMAVARAGAGVNNIPLTRCADQGIVVFNTPGANANAVKELVLTALLMSARNINPAITWTRGLSNDVAKAVEAGKSQFAGSEIKGKTLGIIGIGAIGVQVANAATCLGMNVIGNDPFISVRTAHALSPAVELNDDLEAMLPLCDYVTIHIPFVDETKGMFDSKLLSLMKPTACLLNFSRAAIVKEEDLLDALSNDKLRLYITDFPNDAVVHHEKVMGIPHLGASTEESEENCAIMAVEEIMDYLENGNIHNSVNFPPVNLGPITDKPRLVVLHRSSTDALASVTQALADAGLRAVNLTNQYRDDYAVTATDLDGAVDPEALKAAMEHADILLVRIITPPAKQR
jgi:D-3-phosphoglycerate dehydrogenase